jgi:hypothetical protein
MELDYRLVREREKFLSATGTHKINYSSEDLDGMRIIPAGLLFETGLPTGLPESKGTSHVPYSEDIFSFCFFCWSRMEEYLPFAGDEHGRFRAKNSIFSTGNLYSKPLLDIAIRHFANALKVPLRDRFGIYPTIDIDMGFRYAGKSFLRKLNSIARSGFSFKKVSDFLLADNYQNDPYYTLEYEKKILHGTNARYFFLCGKYGSHDKNISLEYPPMAHWVEEAARYAEVGLHPSYASFGNIERIQSEKNYLESFINKPATRSRQHYLKMNFSMDAGSTYNLLIHAGIEHDYSMGFPDDLGFRAGTACAFHWYDLAHEHATELKVHPFCAMDVTLKNYRGLDPALAKEKIIELKTLCREMGLPFCFIFHNESLSDAGPWKGWRAVFETALSTDEA